MAIIFIPPPAAPDRAAGEDATAIDRIALALLEGAHCDRATRREVYPSVPGVVREYADVRPSSLANGIINAAKDRANGMLGEVR